MTHAETGMALYVQPNADTWLGLGGLGDVAHVDPWSWEMERGLC